MTEDKKVFLTNVHSVLAEVSEDLEKNCETELSEEVFEVMFKIETSLGYYNT